MTPVEMKQREAKIRAARRDLFWARHIAAHGTTPDSRARGRQNVERFVADLKVLGAREEDQ